MSLTVFLPLAPSLFNFTCTIAMLHLQYSKNYSGTLVAIYFLSKSFSLSRFLRKLRSYYSKEICHVKSSRGNSRSSGNLAKKKQTSSLEGEHHGKKHNGHDERNVTRDKGQH